MRTVILRYGLAQNQRALSSFKRYVARPSIKTCIWQHDSKGNEGKACENVRVCQSKKPEGAQDTMQCLDKTIKQIHEQIFETGSNSNGFYVDIILGRINCGQQHYGLLIKQTQKNERLHTEHNPYLLVAMPR
jgi:hypothetical protein